MTVPAPGTAVPVGIALGSNEGDRLANLRAARSRVRNLASGEGVSAPVFETDPVGCPPGAGPFLNTVVEWPFDATTSPARLLAALRAIEGELGRPSRRPRNASRPIDLDILYAGEMVWHTPELTLPHPRLVQRRFVLTPLAAIRPELILPGEHESVAQLLNQLDNPETVVLYASQW